MKIFTTLLFMVFSIAHAGVWSNMQQSGFNQVWEETKNFTTKENEKIKQYWLNEIQPLIEQIAEQVKIKEKNLKILKALEANISIKDQEILFLLEKEKQLLGNETDIKGLKQ